MADAIGVPIIIKEFENCKKKNKQNLKSQKLYTICLTGTFTQFSKINIRLNRIILCL